MVQGTCKQVNYVGQAQTRIILTILYYSLSFRKSTLLHSLRGRLPLLGGKRIENDSLRLGVFTQDLAQELDGEARAVDIVTEYARADYDITISDERARSVMGRLGLRGEKSLRKCKELSGGERARVALSNFAIKPSNCILLDEVSNHLDQEW